MSNSIKGKVKKIGATIVVSDKFQKREMVIETAEKYPQMVQIEFQQALCDKADEVQVGQDVEAHINIRGREWVSPQNDVKYFNTLVCWKLDGQPFTEAIQTPPAVNNASNVPNGAEVDDLPF